MELFCYNLLKRQEGHNSRNVYRGQFEGRVCTATAVQHSPQKVKVGPSVTVDAQGLHNADKADVKRKTQLDLESAVQPESEI